MRITRIVVIGLGEFGRLYADTIRRLTEFELVGICDCRAAHAKAMAAEWGDVDWDSDAERLIERCRPDAAIIATRTDTHIDIALQCLKTGIPVLVEKPLARDQHDGERLLEPMNRSGVAVMVNHICLFHSLFSATETKLHQHGFRHLRFVRHRPASLSKRFPEEHPIRMTMVHDLYQASRLVSGLEPTRFSSQFSTNQRGQIDMTWAQLSWADGRSAHFESFWTLPEGAPPDGWDYLEFFGDGISGRVDTNPGPLQWQETDHQRPVALEMATVEGRPVGMLTEALRSFAAAVHGLRPVPVGCRYQDAIQIQRWVDMLLKNARSFSELERSPHSSNSKSC